MGFLLHNNTFDGAIRIQWDIHLKQPTSNKNKKSVFPDKQWCSPWVIDSLTVLLIRRATFYGQYTLALTKFCFD